MDILRMVVMTILEVVKELAKGANRPELVEKCEECACEVKAYDDLKNGEGKGNG